MRITDGKEVEFVISVFSTSYIHLNPIRVELTKNLEEHTWSNLLDYLGKRKTDFRGCLLQNCLY
ncbi:MAG TPA: hypothetical protein ENG48_05025 [Candidatus Atribacteria bacterium]|nr:hypothetical protein [Candidatus Atribacteria bacterium]